MDRIFEDLSNMTNLSYDFIISNDEQLNCSDYFLEPHADLANLTPQTREMSEEDRTLKLVHHYVYDIIIPGVCVFGFFGNILNVAVFLKKKTCKTLDEIEYCTTICLVSLAISDMMFCFCTFPNAFGAQRYVFRKTEFILYYKVGASFLINTFIMSSTLLTVLTAMMRYTAICHPFRSRQCISLRKTIVAIFFLFIFSVVFNLPHMWRYVIEDIDCRGEHTYVRLRSGDIFLNKSYVYSAHKLLWAVLGNFIPLVILLYCNIRLVRALHQSQKLRFLHSRDNVGCLSAHKRINITLITIIILFFLLVAPSEITKFVLYISKQSKNNYYTYELVSNITNALQCINFSVNFILYYVIIAPFRKTLHEFICIMTIRRRGTRDSSDSRRQQTCVLLMVKDQRRNLL